jgi:Rap1a immunity proteins
MLKTFIRSLAIVSAIIAAAAPTLAQAQQLIGSYVALLSEADHFSSSGQRLTSAAAVIRQDRANFHRFGIKDPQDQGDAFFADEANRAVLEQMLERGRADPGVIARIVNGTPLVRVEIFRNASGPFIKVTLIDGQRTDNSPPPANDDANDYAGPFSTEFLYAMCSQNDTASREKCDYYLQGLLYGLNVQRSMQKKGMAICLPDMTSETARRRILQFIEATTGGNPANNKDGGDWMAFMALAAGNTCK